MAYQAKRAKRFREDFELVDENGCVVHTLHVDLDADDMVPKLIRGHTELTRALAESREISRKPETTEEASAAYEKLGNAVVALYEAVFGIEDARVIVQFYDDRYVEMCKEVTPFITQVVIPRCIEIKNENRKTIMASYNRKQRRALRKRGM